MVHYKDRSKLINHYLTLGIIPANTPPCNNITDGCQLFAVALFGQTWFFIIALTVKSQRDHECSNRTKGHKMTSYHH